MEYEEIIKKLKSLKNPKNVLGMARFGIRPKSEILGVPVPEIRKIAKEIKKFMRSPTSHRLALKLFDSKIHEARLLASMIADPEILSEKQIDKWVKTFDSWDIVDQSCMNLFSKSEIAKNKVLELSNKEKEFEKRTAFALMASLAVHDKKMLDKDFVKYFLIIKKQSIDERNFVKKAVNWALRQIGKRNKNLNKEAIKLAKEIRNINNKASKWNANNAITELTSEPVQNRLKIK
jgi:3-methyladenine DNA glycosylase AlkD